MRILIATIVLCAGAATAQSTFVLSPSTPRAGDEVFVAANSPGGCFPGAGAVVAREGDRVELRITTDDAGCAPAPVNYSIGTFQPGRYVVTVLECPAPPVPCTTGATLDLTVFGVASSPFSVPSLAAPATWMLVLAFVLTATWSRNILKSKA